MMSDESKTAAVKDDLIVRVSNLSVVFDLDWGTVPAVTDVSFDLRAGKTLGVVGESGCGKSVTAQALMRILPDPPGRIASGSILYRRKHGDGEALVDIAALKVNGRVIRSIRGGEIAMIFQEPMNSLSPVHTIGNQIEEAIFLHRKGISPEDARQRAVDMLGRVGIPRPEERIASLPSQLSGGMRQRVMIAMALSCDPRVLIADEPTTAVDVTIQAQILSLLRELQTERGMGIMMITHDLGVVAEMADEVLVMYLGRVMEQASTDSLFYAPAHPYTRLLLKAMPGRKTRGKRLAQIEGSVPAPYEVEAGCPFQTRCPEVHDRCRAMVPPLVEIEKGHNVCCHLYKEAGGVR
jgi:peptide/nickel transport system ATP-binding protein